MVVSNKFTYRFENKWHIVTQEQWDEYNNGKINKTELFSLSTAFEDSNNNQKPINDNYTVTQNIVIIPEYSENLNSYNIKFYNGDGSLMEEKIVEYGVEIKEVYPSNVFPYKLEENNETFNLYEGYNFIGYGFSNKDTTPIDGKTPITSNNNYYALFNKVQDLRKVTPHYEDFFIFEEINSPDGSGEKGYKLSPKYKEMYGKIVIPTTYSNKKIVSIVGFSEKGSNDNNPSIQKISHIFFENDQNIQLIGTNCFKSMQNLKYFEFINSITTLGAQSFFNCGLLSELYNDKLILPNSLKTIETSALNGCFGKRDSIRELFIQIPSSVISMGQYSIAHLQNVKANIQIGYESNPSNLRLSAMPTFNSNNSSQDDLNDIVSISFYTKYYTNIDEIRQYIGSNIKHISILS